VGLENHGNRIKAGICDLDSLIVAGLKTGRFNRGISPSLRKISVSVLLRSLEKARK